MKFSSALLAVCAFGLVGCSAADEPGMVTEDNGEGGQSGSGSLEGGNGGQVVSNVGGAAGSIASGGSAGSPRDAGVSNAPDAGTSVDAGSEPTTGRIAIVAAGYAGRRIVSFDLGATWVGDQTLGGGGDDQFLLRGAAVGAGRLVVVGWKFLSSTDGLKWTEHKNPHGQWQGGVAWGNGMFIAAGGLGQAAKSLDGITWKQIANAGGSHLRRVTFANGEFWTSGDPGSPVYHTKDGVGNWIGGGNYPGDVNQVDDIIVRDSGGQIQVSTNKGASFKNVHGGLVDVAIGRIP
jgi:hypothetical protein